MNINKPYDPVRSYNRKVLLFAYLLALLIILLTILLMNEDARGTSFIPLLVVTVVRPLDKLNEIGREIQHNVANKITPNTPNGVFILYVTNSIQFAISNYREASERESLRLIRGRLRTLKALTDNWDYEKCLKLITELIENPLI